MGAGGWDEVGGGMEGEGEWTEGVGGGLRAWPANTTQTKANTCYTHTIPPAPRPVRDKVYPSATDPFTRSHPDRKARNLESARARVHL